jgi:hypothetical protein
MPCASQQPVWIPAVGQPLTPPACDLGEHSTVGFEKFGNISSISADNAAVFASDPGIIPSTLKPPKELEAPNKQTVLIAQFTVKEGTEFVWQFNVQGMLGDKVARHTWQEHGICATNNKESKHCKQFPVEHTTKAYSVRNPETLLFFVLVQPPSSSSVCHRRQDWFLWSFRLRCALTLRAKSTSCIQEKDEL